MNRATLAVKYALTSSLSFVIMAGLIKSLKVLPVPQLVFFRSSIALVLIGILIFKSKTSLKTKRFKYYILRSLFGCAAMFCFFTSLRVLPLIEQTSLGFSTPIFIAILSMLFLGERPGRSRWLSLAASSIAVLVILRPGANAFAFYSMIVLFGSMLRAAAYVTVRSLTKTEPPLLIVFYFLAITTLLSGLLLPFTTGIPNTEQFISLGLVGLFGALGQITMVKSYSFGEASFVGSLGYLGLLWSGLIDIFIFSDFPDTLVLLGSAILLLSQLFLVISEKRSITAAQEISQSVI